MHGLAAARLHRVVLNLGYKERNIIETSEANRTPAGYLMLNVILNLFQDHIINV